MEITYLGHASFKLKGKTGVVVTDPFDPKMVGLKFPSVEADIVTVSHNHQDHNNITLVKNYSKVIDNPGEYEIKDISILGFSTFHDSKKGEERGKNTIFVFEIDGIRLAHLGDLGHLLSESVVDDMGSIDILMVPVGGGYTISPAEAMDVISSIEPSIIIPMHYGNEKLNQEVFSTLAKEDEVLKVLAFPTEKMDKLSIKKEEIGEEQKMIILSIKQ